MNLPTEYTYTPNQIEMNYPIAKQTELYTDVCAQQNVYNFTFTMPTTSGIGIGLVEITIYLCIGFFLRDEFRSLKKLNVISYFWLLMTVLTGIWEFAFISQYKEVHNYAEQLVQNDTHVWGTRYDLSYVNPWKLSRIFYAEYGAHADREYIALDNHWSRVIEGSHAVLCGLFATLALYFKSHSKNKLYVISATVAMSTQLMNSILYMAQYFYQMRDPNSVNYPSAGFPAGFALWERAFMYVNVFWTLMPLYVIVMEYVLYGKECLCCHIRKRRSFRKYKITSAPFW